MDRPNGFVNDAEQKRLLDVVAEIKQKNPIILGSETSLIYDRWDDDRYFTIAESLIIVGIHTRIKHGKEAVIHTT